MTERLKLKCNCCSRFQSVLMKEDRYLWSCSKCGYPNVITSWDWDKLKEKKHDKITTE